MQPRFSRIRISNWRQFADIDIDLSAHSTVLTGVNGCGKTTILNVLSSHFGWDLSFIASPFVGKKKTRKLLSERRRRTEQEETKDDMSDEVGVISYTNSAECQLLLPQAGTTPEYKLGYSNRPKLPGLLIPAHRPSMSFQRIQQLPTDPKNNQQQYQEFQTLLQQTYGSANVRNPGLILKQSLISLALFGYGNPAVEGNPEYRDLFERFQKVLHHVLPPSLGFQKIEVRMPDVVLMTDSGTFALDAMSGGINSLFGIAWQIFMYGADKGGCTVIIDEPENHLHPSMQRTLLPSLEKAFPEYRFVVATHSPFIVTSNSNANVYALAYNQEKRIESSLIEMEDFVGTPEKTLREVLDVPTTIPVWVEEKVEEILKKYDDVPDSDEKVQSIMTEFKKHGLGSALFGIDVEK